MTCSAVTVHDRLHDAGNQFIILFDVKVLLRMVKKIINQMSFYPGRPVRVKHFVLSLTNYVATASVHDHDTKHRIRPRNLICYALFYYWSNRIIKSILVELESKVHCTV